MSKGTDSIERARRQLIGDDAPRVVARALPAGAQVVRVEPRQVLNRPGKRVSVKYDVDVRWPDDRVSEEIVVALADRRGLPHGATTVDLRGTPVAVWQMADDPLLPGLGVAMNARFARDVLADLGVRPTHVETKTRAYRPGRRAVIEVTATLGGGKKLVLGAGGTIRTQPESLKLFLKVLPRDEVGEVFERYQRLDGAVPIAPCHLVDHAGVLALEGMPGRTLRQCLKREKRVPPPRDVVALSEGLASVELPGEPYSDNDELLGDHVRLLRAVVPGRAETLDRLEEAFGRPGSPQPVATVHGDFHEAQILVENGHIAGLLDVDDAGPGERVDDLALIIGRLWTLAHDGGPESVREYTLDLLRESDKRVDPEELRRRVGTALLGRATAPYRNNMSEWRARTDLRLDLAERWADSPPF